MGFLIKGSLALSVMMLVGFFAAYELMGIPALGALEDERLDQRTARRHPKKNNHATASPLVSIFPGLDDTPVSGSTEPNVNTTLLECLSQGYQLSDVCNVTESKSELLGALATFEDLSSVLFLDDVVDNLQTTCQNSSWCLTLEDEKRLYTELGESYLAFCDLTECLVDMADECMTDERRLVLASLFLMCRANQEDATGECLLAIRQMTHVAMADLYREIAGTDSPDSCHSSNNKSCNGPCYELGWQLHCMCAICNHNMDMLSEFRSWQWFYTVEDAMEQCGINDTESECEMFIQPEVFLVEYGTLYQMLDKMDPKALVGIGISVLVAFSGVGIVIWAFACRIRRSRRDRVEYTDIKSSEIQALIDSEDAEDDQLPA